jgi:methionyl-tRNA formyltransferase
MVETPQDESLVTYTALVTKADALIDWSVNAERVERMVRAYDPWPTARSLLGNEDLLIWKAAVMSTTTTEAAGAAPGTLIELMPTPIVRCGVGSLALLEVQAPGRRRMSGAEFFRGRRATVGIRLGS